MLKFVTICCLLGWAGWAAGQEIRKYHRSMEASVTDRSSLIPINALRGYDASFGTACVNLPLPALAEDFYPPFMVFWFFSCSHLRQERVVLCN